jgi:hypothetical protein
LGYDARAHGGQKFRARQAYRQRIAAYALLPVAILRQAARLILALLLAVPTLILRIVGWGAGRAVRLVKR